MREWQGDRFVQNAVFVFCWSLSSDRGRIWRSLAFNYDCTKSSRVSVRDFPTRSKVAIASCSLTEIDGIREAIVWKISNQVIPSESILEKQQQIKAILASSRESIASSTDEGNSEGMRDERVRNFKTSERELKSGKSGWFGLSLGWFIMIDLGLNGVFARLWFSLWVGDALSSSVAIYLS
ncbi:MAG: hypothetical protein J7647_12620 [Cyanobacteria bacterium SBLK]|nr:hypothetical protein [Cyanobacteria bacterium SBLK]